MPIPKDSFAFTDALADILRLPDETLAMSYIYMNKYLRFYRTSNTPNSLDSTPQLTTLTPTYTTLRSTLVQAELILLRVLAFELDLPSPFQYLARYLTRAMEDVETAGEGFDEWGQQAKEEYGVLVGGIMEGRCKNYELSNLFPARAVALGVVYLVLGERGLKVERDVNVWVQDVGSGKVDVEDFEEVVEMLRKT
ncbi:MAG: hypothetical protein Q9186_002629 [Xanthomendoza sp. 1 TL-2023]